jgi:hypothetical protein
MLLLSSGWFGTLDIPQWLLDEPAVDLAERIQLYLKTHAPTHWAAPDHDYDNTLETESEP